MIKKLIFIQIQLLFKHKPMFISYNRLGRTLFYSFNILETKIAKSSYKKLDPYSSFLRHLDQIPWDSLECLVSRLLLIIGAIPSLN